MAKIITTNVEHNAIQCDTLDDLDAAMKELRELDNDTQIELSITIDIPGLGKRKLLLLDEVSVLVAWSTETD